MIGHNLLTCENVREKPWAKDGSGLVPVAPGHLMFTYAVLMSLHLIAVLAVARRKTIPGTTSGAVK